MNNNFSYIFLFAFTTIMIVNCHKHSEKPLLLLISFDGFRWDYLQKHNLTNFNYLKSVGSHAEWINNSFATVTFPNHWTIVTGFSLSFKYFVHTKSFL